MAEVIQHAREGAAASERASEAAKLLADYYRLVERVEALRSRGGGEGEARPTNSDFGRLTLHEAALLVLREVGYPLHARELGERIKAKGWRHRRSRVARPDQIVYQLAARLPRYPQLFVRVAPNTFGLREWNEHRAQPKAPRLATFHGPGKPVARTISSSEEHLREASWRSS